MAITGGTTNGVNMALMILAAGGDKVETKVSGGSVRCFRETFTMAAQAKDATIGVAFLPKGSTPLYGIIVPSVTMGASATIAVGNSTDGDKYRAAAVVTAVVPEVYGKAIATASVGDELTADEEVLFTIGTAALAAAGNVRNFMFYMTAQ